MNYKQALDISHLRLRDARRLPRVAREFLERGTEDETTLAENRAAFQRIRLKPEARRAVS